uniref:Uncharacterized protein n=1 Tax=Ixodes ricinus TaxID=34613 RepID=V5HF64_IXORI
MTSSTSPPGAVARVAPVVATRPWLCGAASCSQAQDSWLEAATCTATVSSGRHSTRLVEPTAESPLPEMHCTGTLTGCWPCPASPRMMRVSPQRPMALSCSGSCSCARATPARVLWGWRGSREKPASPPGTPHPAPPSAVSVPSRSHAQL